MDTNQDILNAVAALRGGGVIIYPTDTVWGIGCDATDSAAVRRIFAIKKRADSKALITLVADSEMLGRYVSGDLSKALALLSESERPTTVVYPHAANLSPELLAPDGSAGMRITSEPVSAALCRQFGGAIVSTSANISGEPTPSAFGKISTEILDAADYVMTSRRDEHSEAKPSRVLRLNADGTVDIIRP